MEQRYETLFEFKIRLLKPKPQKGDELVWVFDSLGINELGLKIYKLLSSSESLTRSEITDKLNESEEKVIEALDTLYSVGFIDRLGEAYFISKDLASSIRTRTKRIISKILDDIAKVIEHGG